ncbi:MULTISPECIES: hypothetical protein [Enterococcus]|uniref:hypothetical protein n=1 Tax=Enterococcus TaxID=1350 RepID=UPI000376F1B2|nr:hypothetical protein [Enterococcus mundtii]MBO1086637.1 hypothetical protein [Enterococcus mundtii]MDV7745626.1 hypothetical protein [Enterococcus mundtii]OBS61368.1 hypothetical protein AX758_13075 [Enterococcus mundtii]PQC30793.1 hypothetical protein CUM97_07295 [Enterococcus mundtii]
MEGEEATDNHRNVAGFKEGINRLPCSSDDFFITYKWIGTKLSSKRSTVLKSQCSSKKVNRSKKIR